MTRTTAAPSTPSPTLGRAPAAVQRRHLEHDLSAAHGFFGGPAASVDQSAARLDRPVQRATDADTGLDDADVTRHAARGVAGSGGPLPHLDTIQRAFGPHDVTGVRAHVGGPAAEAADAIGAQAYATGDQVAFATEPDLFLAAHEAAHVVQQRQGVSLKGAVGQVGDAYEQHADAVAAAVVRGESVEDLLGAGASGGGGAVQRAGKAKAKDQLPARWDLGTLGLGEMKALTVYDVTVTFDEDVAGSVKGAATGAPTGAVPVPAGGVDIGALKATSSNAARWQLAAFVQGDARLSFDVTAPDGRHAATAIDVEVIDEEQAPVVLDAIAAVLTESAAPKAVPVPWGYQDLIAGWAALRDQADDYSHRRLTRPSLAGGAKIRDRYTRLQAPTARLIDAASSHPAGAIIEVALAPIEKMAVAEDTRTSISAAADAMTAAGAATPGTTATTPDVVTIAAMITTGRETMAAWATHAANLSADHLGMAEATGPGPAPTPVKRPKTKGKSTNTAFLRDKTKLANDYGAAIKDAPAARGAAFDDLRSAANIQSAFAHVDAIFGLVGVLMKGDRPPPKGAAAGAEQLQDIHALLAGATAGIGAAGYAVLRGYGDAKAAGDLFRWVGRKLDALGAVGDVLSMIHGAAVLFDDKPSTTGENVGAVVEIATGAAAVAGTLIEGFAGGPAMLALSITNFGVNAIIEAAAPIYVEPVRIQLVRCLTRAQASGAQALGSARALAIAQEAARLERDPVRAQVLAEEITTHRDALTYALRAMIAELCEGGGLGPAQDTFAPLKQLPLKTDAHLASGFRAATDAWVRAANQFDVLLNACVAWNVRAHG